MKILNSFLSMVAQRSKSHGSQYYAFSVFAMLNFVAPMFVTSMFEDFSNELILLRVVAVILCLFLSFAEFWPSKFKVKILPIYWYITLWFCLPFLASYTALATHGDENWLLNAMLSLLLLMMLVDWLAFVILTSIGIVAGYILYILIHHNSTIPIYIPANNIYLFAYVCAFMIVTALLFLRKKEETQTSKMEMMQLFGGAIAHEVKSPIHATNMLVTTLHDVADDVYKKARKEVRNNRIHYLIDLEEKDFEMLFHVIPNGLLQSSKEANKVVHVLLMALKGSVANRDKEYSMALILRDAILNYDFAEDQKNRLQVRYDNDFMVIGSNEMLKYVIFNLIRNAFKYGGAEITIKIWLEDNKLHFQDNGQGIPADEMKNIFKLFYTKSQSGAGIGLAFCNIVMQLLGGEIECQSEVGKYTEFILSFPNRN